MKCFYCNSKNLEVCRTTLTGYEEKYRNLVLGCECKSCNKRSMFVIPIDGKTLVLPFDMNDKFNREWVNYDEGL